MEQLQHNISAEELFGKSSHLVVAQEGGDTFSEIAQLGTLYQIATAIVALLFIFILVRYLYLFRHILLSFFSNKAKHSDMHIYTAEIHNIKIFTSVAGISLLSLLLMRLSVLNGFSYVLAPLRHLSHWQLGGVVFGAITALVIAERALLYIVGFISERHDICEEIGKIKLLHFSTTIIGLMPLLVLALLTEGDVTKYALYCSVTVCSISLILFVKETFLLFRAQRFSIFHWILYLCALEIFPLSLLLAPIARG